MDDVTARLLQSLQKRKDLGTHRVLPESNLLADFTSNDYLGLSRNETLKSLVAEEFTKTFLPMGATGSRLLSGNYRLIERVEKKVADFHKAEAALMFTSGYAANVGLLSTLPQKGDTILYDSYCHASIKYGIRLSHAKTYAFRHNDLADLQSKKRLCEGNVFVITESVFSMDGDVAPLADLVRVCRENNFCLIVDEAHTTGMNGAKGEGLVCELGLEKEVFARVHTFGKAVGLQGAVITGSEVLRQYLVNYCHAFIYSTAVSPLLVLAIQKAYEILPQLTAERAHIQVLHNRLKTALSENSGFVFKGSGAVNCLLVSGNENVRKASAFLEAKGCNIKPILSPTVPKGQERLRICLHSYNTEEELERLVEGIKELRTKSQAV